MPQKRNYDLFEIMRANARVFEAKKETIFGIIAGLGSGYHRDFQLTKKPFVEAIAIAKSTIEVLTEAVLHLSVNKTALAEAMTPELFATEEVYKKVAAGMPFREAYLEVKKMLKKD